MNIIKILGKKLLGLIVALLCLAIGMAIIYYAGTYLLPSALEGVIRST